QEIIRLIGALDYKVLQSGQAKAPDSVSVISYLVMIAALYILLQSTGVLTRLVPSQLADAGMGYGMLFVIGLITSVHCVAMCGGINLSQSLPRGTEDSGRLGALAPSFAYNLGRVCSYTAVGFILGLLGMLLGGRSGAGVSALLQGSLKLLAGCVMVVMGVNLLGLFPALRRFTLRPPRFLLRFLGKRRGNAAGPFLVGLLNGLMPCGPLQSMWLVALAAANPFTGALSMLLFSLGTVPLMLGLGSAVSLLGRRFTDSVMKVGAILVIVLGLAMLSQGGALSGWLSQEALLSLTVAFAAAGALYSLPIRQKWLKYGATAAAAVLVVAAFTLWNTRSAAANGNAQGEASVVDGVQVVSSALSSGSYPNITVQAGLPVRWVVEAPAGTVNGCNYRMLIQEYGIDHAFAEGEHIIEFPPTQPGTVRTSCWMGMIHGNIFVTDQGQEHAAEQSAVKTGSDQPPEELPKNEIPWPVVSGYQIPTAELAVADMISDDKAAFQEVEISLTENGFLPAVIVVQKNVPVFWNIDNQLENAKSGTGLLAPYYSTALALEPGINELSLYPSESFDVSTGDNRFYCYVKVVDDLKEIDEAEIRDEAENYEPMIYPAEIFERPAASCCD
ncbi:MAG: sulfite exporter TauE/SafE family protein, partial [Oscillospiraceae bacterium]|nr:sulfite exporter TauE/SafE family protein [Oscillospiraceae bacterium]